MPIIKTPPRIYKLGEHLPPIEAAVMSWPWGATPSLQSWSLQSLEYPLGTILYDIIDGYPVIAQIQTHDGYGAHPDWPQKPHKGTSVYVPAVKNSEGHRVALRDPPPGWGDPEAAATISGEIIGRHEQHWTTWRPSRGRSRRAALVVGGVVTGALLAGPPGAAIGGLIGALWPQSHKP